MSGLPLLDIEHILALQGGWLPVGSPDREERGIAALDLRKVGLKDLVIEPVLEVFLAHVLVVVVLAEVDIAVTIVRNVARGKSGRYSLQQRMSEQRPRTPHPD